MSVNTTLYIRLLENKLVDFYQKKANYAQDSGFDLYCPAIQIVKARGYATIDFKIQCAPQFSIVSGYYLYPRSSISKTPLSMANSVGIIDWGYRGNIMARVYNNSDQDYEINSGDRLFQLCHPTLQPLNIAIVDTLDNTDRSTGGFGSTGR